METTEKVEWHWQEPKTAWRGIGIYHITMTVSSRQPLLGTLVIPEDDPKQARVERTLLGNKVVAHLLALPKRHPEIKVVSYCLMPDHLHTIWHVTSPMKSSILSVIKGFWQGEKKIGRGYSMSVTPHSMRENEHNATREEMPDEIRRNGHNAAREGGEESTKREYVDPIFHEMPYVRPLSRKGQLNTMINYVMLNPERLAVKRMMPGYFRVQEGIEIGGRRYCGVGNVEILQAQDFAPVHVRRTMVEEAEQGDDKRLRDYMNGCVIKARKGTVMVSPYISQHEKEVLAVLLKEGSRVIYIEDNGFRDYYKPSAILFDSVAAGKVLILSPWEYDPKKKHVSREDCVEMNRMAEEICGQWSD